MFSGVRLSAYKKIKYETDVVYCLPDNMFDFINI